MAVVHKTVFIGYSAAQMFALVEQVEKYPEFLPWCGEVKVAERSETNLIATLAINFHGIKQSFTTKNINQPPHSMQMNLVDGPFRQLTGGWKFTELRPDACKIEFDMQYEFSSMILAQIVGPVFGMIANSMVDSFCKRAEVVYG